MQFYFEVIGRYVYSLRLIFYRLFSLF